MKTLRTLAATLAVTLVSLLATPSAEALSIVLSDGGAGLATVTDGGPGDASPIAGIVAFSATVGVFEVVLTAGFSDPITGSATSPSLVFNLEALTTSGGTLTAMLSDNSFGPSGTTAHATILSPPPLNLGPPLPLAATSTIGYGTYYSATNTEFALDTLLTLMLSPGAATGFLPSGTGPYSLTQLVQITSSPGVTTAAATLSVPDGGLALSLLGFALVGVEGLRRRFKK